MNGDRQLTQVNMTMGVRMCVCVRVLTWRIGLKLFLYALLRSGDTQETQELVLFRREIVILL